MALREVVIGFSSIRRRTAESLNLLIFAAEVGTDATTQRSTLSTARPGDYSLQITATRCRHSDAVNKTIEDAARRRCVCVDGGIFLNEETTVLFRWCEVVRQPVGTAMLSIKALVLLLQPCLRPSPTIGLSR